MKEVIEKICICFKGAVVDSQQSFWLQGTYGTGKTYAAVVLKHLFEETYENVGSFFDKNMLLHSLKVKFESIRNKGDYLVIWKSGADDIKTCAQLFMAVEYGIKRALDEKFGVAAKYGSESLVDKVCKKINDKSINWEHIYNESGEWKNCSFEEFKEKIDNRDINAVYTANGADKQAQFQFLHIDTGFQVMGERNNRTQRA